MDSAASPLYGTPPKRDVFERDLGGVWPPPGVIPGPPGLLEPFLLIDFWIDFFMDFGTNFDPKMIDFRSIVHRFFDRLFDRFLIDLVPTSIKN